MLTFTSKQFEEFIQSSRSQPSALGHFLNKILCGECVIYNGIKDPRESKRLKFDAIYKLIQLGASTSEQYISNKTLDIFKEYCTERNFADDWDGTVMGTSNGTISNFDDRYYGVLKALNRDEDSIIKKLMKILQPEFPLLIKHSLRIDKDYFGQISLIFEKNIDSATLEAITKKLNQLDISCTSIKILNQIDIDFSIDMDNFSLRLNEAITSTRQGSVEQLKTSNVAVNSLLNNLSFLSKKPKIESCEDQSAMDGSNRRFSLTPRIEDVD